MRRLVLFSLVLLEKALPDSSPSLPPLSLAPLSSSRPHAHARSPAAKMAEERALHESKLAKMELEMKMVFQQKVNEKEAKLKQSEEELYARHREMKEALEKQRVELEDKKRRIEQGRPLTPEKVRLSLSLSLYVERSLQKELYTDAHTLPLAAAAAAVDEEEGLLAGVSGDDILSSPFPSLSPRPPRTSPRPLDPTTTFTTFLSPFALVGSRRRPRYLAFALFLSLFLPSQPHAFVDSQSSLVLSCLTLSPPLLLPPFFLARCSTIPALSRTHGPGPSRGERARRSQFQSLSSASSYS